MRATFGIGPRDVVGLVRGAGADADPGGVIAVAGPRATELADALARDGERSLVRVTADPAGAAALVVCVDGPATEAQEAAMRNATRAGVPVVTVQLGDPATRLAYALPGDVVVATPGHALPVHAVVETLAAALRGNGIAFAARLPALREPVTRLHARRAALATAALAGLSRRGGPMLPVLALAQARMLRQAAIARGGANPADPAGLATALGPELGAALAMGVTCRAIARRLPLRGRATDALVALAGTAALAVAADRLR